MWVLFPGTLRPPALLASSECWGMTVSNILNLPKCWGYERESCTLSIFLNAGGMRESLEHSRLSLQAIKLAWASGNKAVFNTCTYKRTHTLTNTMIAEQWAREGKRKLRRRATLCGHLIPNKECVPRDAMTDSRWRNREPTPFHQLHAHSYITSGNE